MLVSHYSVSQVRVAATCPRLHWFDAWASKQSGKTFVSRIWKHGGDATACGSLFHRAVEKFTRIGASDPAVAEILRSSEGETELQQGLTRYLSTKCIDLEALKRRHVDERRAFVAAIHRYAYELAVLVNASLSIGVGPQELVESLFGDPRRRVDMTFHLPSVARPIHVSGQIDYVYWSAATKGYRILDYKLTPSTHSSNDMFQVAVYALMHDHQHRTRPDIAVYYLHPNPAVVETRWEKLSATRGKVYDLLASMEEWKTYDPESRTGLLPPGDLSHCVSCKHHKSGACERRLGPKTEGSRLRVWEEAKDPGVAPEIVVHPQSSTTERVEIDPLDDVGDVEDAVLAGEAPPIEEAIPASAREDIQDRPTIGGPWTHLVLGSTKPARRMVELPVQHLNTHVAVVGAAGSGKTWTAKVVAEEAIRRGVPVLAIDPQGDLVQFLHQRREDEVDPQWREWHQEFCSKVETRVYTPGTSHARRLSLQPLRALSAESLKRVDDPQRRAEEYESMLSGVATNLVNLCGIGGATMNASSKFVYRLLGALFRTEAKEVGFDLLARACHEPEDFGVDDADLIIPKAVRLKLAQALYGLTLGSSGALFKQGEPLDIANLVRPTTPGKVPLNVIYLNALSTDAEKQFFVAALAAEVYRWMVCELEAGGQTNMLFYLDEARDYIPAGTAQPPAKQPLVRLFSQGRKYGVGCLICTQSPRSVDYNVFSNASTKLIGRLESAQDVERVVAWFSSGGAPPKWIAGRKEAVKGTFVARWPELPVDLDGQEFASRPLFSVHEGAWSPERLEREYRKLHEPL